MALIPMHVLFPTMIVLLLALLHVLVDASTTHTGKPPYWTGMTHVNPRGATNDWGDTNPKTRVETARSQTSGFWITVWCDEGLTSLGVDVFPAKLYARRTNRHPSTWYNIRSTTSENSNGNVASLQTIYTANAPGMIDPTIATDSSGTWIVAFSVMTSAGDGDVFVVRSTNDGVSFSAAQLISSATGEPQDNALDIDPHLLFDPASNSWIVAWQSAQNRDGTGTDSDVAVVISTNSGASFSTPQIINTGATTDSYTNNGIQVFSPSNGTVQVVYAAIDTVSSRRRFFQVRKNLVDNTPWTSASLFGPQDNSSEVVKELHAAYDWNHNAVVVCYTTDDAIKTSVSIDNGVAFAPGTVLATDSTATEPQIGTDSRGVFTAVYTTGVRSFYDVFTNVNTEVRAEKEIFYSVSTGQNNSGIGNGWTSPKPLDARNYNQEGISSKPKLFVDAPRRTWVVVFPSTKYSHLQTSGDWQESVWENADSDVFFTFWEHNTKEMCNERSNLITPHCLEALQDAINALPPTMSSFQTIKIAGQFRIRNGALPAVSAVIRGGRKVAIISELPEVDYIQQEVNCPQNPIFIVDNRTSALRFSKTTVKVVNSPLLVLNRGGAPAANLEIEYDPTDNAYGNCGSFSGNLKCPVGFRPPQLPSETRCVPCTEGYYCPLPYTSSTMDQARPCPFGSWCSAGSYQHTVCKSFHYYSPAAPTMTALSDCTTTGTPCLPGYRCPPAARVENHTQVVLLDNSFFTETLVFPGERTVQFTIRNVRPVAEGQVNRVSLIPSSTLPGWLQVSSTSGRFDPNFGEILYMKAVLKSNVAGTPVSEQLTATYVLRVFDYDEGSSDYTAPLVVTFVRQVTSVIFSPEEGVKNKLALGDPAFNGSMYVFNIGCEDSVSFEASVWDCYHPNAPPITSALGSSTEFPLDWAYIEPGFRNGSLPVGSADPAEIRVILDPSSSIMNDGLLSTRLPASSTTLSKLGTEGLFLAQACIQVKLVLERDSIPLVKNVPIEIQLYENCPAGYYSLSGTSELSSCTPCPLGTYTSTTGTRVCTGCPESRPRTFGGAKSLDGCLTAPGTVRDLDGSTLDCFDLGEGVNCNREGILLEEVPLRPGYWRSDNKSKSIMQCLHHDFCVGGNGKTRQKRLNTSDPSSSNATLRRLQEESETGGGYPEDDYVEILPSTGVNYCLEHHTGALCEGCAAGYVRRGAAPCSICNSAALAGDRLRLSWTIIAAICIVILAFVVVQRKAIFSFLYKAKKTANDIRRGSIHAFASGRNTLVGRRKSVGADHHGIPPVSNSGASFTVNSPANVEESSNSTSRETSSVGKNTKSSFSMDFARRGKGSVGFADDMDSDLEDNSNGRMRHTSSFTGTRDRTWTRNRMLNASMRMSQRLHVKERASYLYRIVTSVESNTTLRILLSLFQVCSGISTTFVELFPPIYHQAVAILNIVSASFFYNIDFACVLTSNHYFSLVLAMLVPFLAIMLIVVGHIILEGRLKRNRQVTEVAKLRNGSFSLFLLLLFLIYPNVANTILSTFACRSFDDGTAYLRKDLTIDCNAPDRPMWLAIASIGTLVYVAGVPFIYLFSLLRVRKYILDTSKASSTEDYESVMFLIEPYRRECWWYEVFELIRKLIQTSLLVFFLDGSVLQTMAMIVVSGIVIVVINELRPYKLLGANRLASTAQWCILIISFLGMLYKVDLEKLDSRFNYDKEMMLDTLVMIALFVTPALAFYQQRKFVHKFVVRNFERVKVKFNKCCLCGCPRRKSSSSSDEDMDGRIVVTGPSVVDMPINQ